MLFSAVYVLQPILTSACAMCCSYVKQGRTILQPHHLLDELNNLGDADQVAEIKDSAFGNLLQNCQEAMVLPPWVGFAVRPRPGIWEYVRINVEELTLEELSVSEYLSFKEQLANGTEYVPRIFFQIVSIYSPSLLL